MSAPNTYLDTDDCSNVGIAKPERLRLFFFSDWRLQPLELVEALLDAAGPIDLILYGGDDIGRFKPPPVIPAGVVSGVEEQFLFSAFNNNVMKALRAGDLGSAAQSDLASIGTAHSTKVIALAAEVLGRLPLRELPDTPYPTLGQILDLFYPTEVNNRFHQMAKKVRFGVGAVLGNDCRPSDRVLLECAGVRDLHETPVVFGGWGFVGIEGAIYQDREDGQERINGLGYVLHSDQEIAAHLANAHEHLHVPAQRLVIVSHTPPAGCGLDVGLRFGLDHLGSPAVATFIEKIEPALVLCGHCHCRGGKTAQIGKTLIVNGASDDRKIQDTRAAVIELAPDQPPTVTWLDPTPHSVVFIPGIGPKTAKQLATVGVTRPAQLFDAPAEVFKGIHFGEVRQRRLEAYRQATAENRPVWLPGPPLRLPEDLLFYDVETGLNLGSPSGFSAESSQEPWMIAALTPDEERVEQWVAADEERAVRREMYRHFLDFIRRYPEATLCSWSGTRFDERAVATGLKRWHRRARAEWERLPQLDLLSLLKPRLVLPTTDWSLKTVARWCGFVWEDPEEIDLDGFEVGLRYEVFREWGTPLPLDAIARYNAADVLALAHVANWADENLRVLNVL